MQPSNIHDKARGRWRSILPALGVPKEFLTGKHGPCPFCGGTDRYRFSDLNGGGNFICNQCGSGTGVDFVMKFKGLNGFLEAKNLIENTLPETTIEVKKATEKRSFSCSKYWDESHEITQHDAAGLYLRNRGFKFRKYPEALRFHPSFKYVHDDNRVTQHPCMVAKFSAPDDKSYTLQFTYLTKDGDKAKLPSIRKMASGPMPFGGAVRLTSKHDYEKIGIAEGVETALSAAKMFQMPVWATFSAALLMKWQPTASAKEIVIYADNDKNYKGQSAAYALAHKLISLNENIKVSVEYPDRINTDWNDELQDLQHQKGGPDDTHN